jgi:predicted DsbA family dithiol-disulfide isomerase
MDTQLRLSRSLRPVVVLDLIADLACPWSFLGKRNLERALLNLHGASAPALRWHGFRMAPSGPDAAAGPRPAWASHVAQRLPANVGLDPALQALREAGRPLGIAFDFARIAPLPDTSEAHRLLHLAAADGRQGELADALFSAYFEHGRDIGQPEVLRSIAVDSGLGAHALAEFAAPGRGRDAVLEEEQRLRGMGVVATPNLLINGRVLVQGPADVPTYVQALDQALFPGLEGPEDRRLLH